MKCLKRRWEEPKLWGVLADWWWVLFAEYQWLGNRCLRDVWTVWVRILDYEFDTGQKIIPSVLGCAYEIGLECQLICLEILFVTKEEVVGSGKDGIGDAAKEFINFV